VTTAEKTSIDSRSSSDDVPTGSEEKLAEWSDMGKGRRAPLSNIIGERRPQRKHPGQRTALYDRNDGLTAFLNNPAYVETKPSQSRG
jgi:hypothetical protein